MSDNDEYKSGAEGIALLEKTKWGTVKKQRRITKLAGAAKRGIGKYMAERKEKKEIYKEAYKKAEKGAIISRARREARARYAPKPKGRGRGAGLFDLPSGFAAPTVMGESFLGKAPKRRKAKRRKPIKKKRSGRRPVKRVEYYY